MDCPHCVEATEEYREFICPKCGSEFADPDPTKPFEAGILCPECTGGLKGVIHPRIIKRRITQTAWDELKLQVKTLREHLSNSLDSVRDASVETFPGSEKWNYFCCGGSFVEGHAEKCPWNLADKYLESLG